MTDLKIVTLQIHNELIDVKEGEYGCCNEDCNKKMNKPKIILLIEIDGGYAKFWYCSEKCLNNDKHFHKQILIR